MPLSAHLIMRLSLLLRQPLVSARSRLRWSYGRRVGDSRWPILTRPLPCAWRSSPTDAFRLLWARPGFAELGLRRHSKPASLTCCAPSSLPTRYIDRLLWRILNHYCRYAAYYRLPPQTLKINIYTPIKQYNGQEYIDDLNSARIPAPFSQRHAGVFVKPGTGRYATY